MSPDTIQYLLTFRKEVLSQMLVGATIFGAFSISGAVAILVSVHRDRLFRYLLITLCLSSLAFIFATSLDVILLSTLKNEGLKNNPTQALGVIRLANAVTYSVMAGTFFLVLSIAGFGFAFSRKIGWVIFSISLACILCFIWCCYHLDQLLR